MPRLTGAGIRWPPGGVGLPSGLSLEGSEGENTKSITVSKIQIQRGFGMCGNVRGDERKGSEKCSL